MPTSPNRPPLPVVITYPPLTGGKVTMSTKERVPLKQPTIKASDITDAKGNVSADMIVRVLGLIQAAIEDATLLSRSDPLGMKCIVRNITLASGQNSNIKHSLGVPWKSAHVIGAASGSASCTLTHTSPVPSNVDQSQYASITPTGTGVYDIVIYPG